MNRWTAAALAALLLSAADARAALYCVDSEAQLRAALATIGASFDSSVHEIRLTQRVFFTGTQAFAVQVSGPTGDTVISGGWSAGASTACDVQTVDARMTVLDAQGTSSVLSIRRNSISGNASPLIRVANLTLRNGSAESAPVGLNVANSFGRIEVDNVIAHGHRALASQFLGGVAMTLDSSSNDISLRNSLIYDNVGNFVGGFPLSSVLFTSLSLNSNRNWYVTNNTIVTAPGPISGALRLQSDGNFWVSNNVLEGEVAYASSITGAGAATAPVVRQYFNNFAVAPVSSGAIISASLGNTAFDPLLDPVTRGLTPGSPLVNAGLGSPPGDLPARDAFGQPRVFGTFIDVGAVELQQAPVLPERIFGDGFE